jgi:K(+)-stimulated pyrophosphate-energized sodium pump
VSLKSRSGKSRVNTVLPQSIFEVSPLNEFLPVIVVAIVALLFACYLYLKNAAIKIHNERIAEIAGYISEGAMAYLKRQYSVLAIFIVVMFAIIGLAGLGWSTGLCFVIGALFSIGSGFFGMKSATKSNVRTAQSAEKSLKVALDVAFSSGAVLVWRWSAWVHWVWPYCT